MNYIKTGTALDVVPVNFGLLFFTRYKSSYNF